MKDWNTLKGTAQKEALINELKGNIFEFLLASLLARHWNHESEFLTHFTSLDGGKVHQDFSRYQQYLLEEDRELYLQLPQLAKLATQYLCESTSFFKDFKPTQTHLLGKWASSFSAGDDLKESDLVFIDDKDRVKGLSLKFCKSRAFVNTKSGGIRSFIERYFSGFKGATDKQVEFNSFLDQSFIEMRQECYQWADLSFSEDFDDGVAKSDKSRTQFDKQWTDHGLPTLPGQLPDEIKQKLHAHYQRVIKKLYSCLEEFWQADAQLFSKCLLPLAGLSANDLSQLTLFHKEIKGQRYQLDHFEYLDRKTFIKDNALTSWPTLKEGISSFELDLGPSLLQIRVKPMNTFIVSGLKVNCSVKSLY